jgi:hypothetical protein
VLGLIGKVGSTKYSAATMLSLNPSLSAKLALMVGATGVGLQGIRTSLGYLGDFGMTGR